MEGNRMAKKKFTEDEMEILKSSPYVLDVRPSIVHFSAEFKEAFWSLSQQGKAPREIVVELGLDPVILGESRISGLKIMIRNEVRAGRGFRDQDTYGKYIQGHADPEVKIKHLEHQIAYKDQEIEFLKKIVSLGKGAAEL
jgi:hypothetical protein